MRRGVSGVLIYFLREYPARSGAVIVLSILAGLAEGVGIAAVLPLLELASASPGSSESLLMGLTRSAFGLIGLELTLGTLAVFVVCGLFLKGVFLWLASLQIGYAVASVATDLRLDMIQALLQARWSYFIGQQAGHLSNAIGMEANRAASAYLVVCQMLALAVQVLIYTIAAILISPLVALAALVVGSGIAALFVRLVRTSREAGREQTRLIKSLSGRLIDAIQGLKPIKAMAQEEHLQPLLEAEIEEINQAKRRQVIATGTMSSFQEPILVLMLMIGLYSILSLTDMPLSGLLVMVFLFHRLVGRIHQVQMKYQNLVVCESAFWSLRDAIELARSNREADSVGGRTSTAISMGIRLDDVWFSYPDQPVLKGASLTIPAGKFVSIVGPSGAGKTTIVDLVIGLLRPDAGDIHVDSWSLDELDLVTWRQSVGYVPQEMLLFHNSIYGNVTLGDASISRDAVAAALRDAGASEFVDRLPKGMDTMIGERGAKLSGGQRQRVAIARALVRRPQLLVLDEVTTALDPETEEAICTTLRGIAGDVTILAISHQPAIARVSDMVYRIEDGRTTLDAQTGELMVGANT